MIVRLRDGLLMAETCKVAVIWVSGKDDSHFENFCHPPSPYNKLVFNSLF